MLRARYFSEFKGGPSLLLWGIAEGMRHLIAVLEKILPAGGEFLMSGFMNDAPNLVLRSAMESRGLHRRQDTLFEWILDPQTVADFRDKVQVLATANRPGHQYLECNTADEITVTVSCNEYPDRWPSD
jgi:hypothetical protein